MPAFIFLSGFFAKGAGNKSYIYNLAKKLLLPYLVFQALYTVFYFLIGKENWMNSVFDPQWALWFLFSLFSWHLMLILFKKIGPRYGLALAVLIGLAIGYVPEVGSLFSLSRTFVFFPFFLAGFWVRTEQLQQLKKPIIKGAGLVIMIAVALFIHWMPDLDSGWLLASKPYSMLESPFMGVITRGLVYVTAVVMASSVLAWIPSRHFKLTVLGARTLYVYLLHGFFIQTFRKQDLFSIDNIIDATELAIVAAVIVLVLSSKPVLKLWQPFIEGRWNSFWSFIRGNTGKRSQVS